MPRKGSSFLFSLRSFRKVMTHNKKIISKLKVDDSNSDFGDSISQVHYNNFKKDVLNYDEEETKKNTNGK